VGLVPITLLIPKTQLTIIIIMSTRVSIPMTLSFSLLIISSVSRRKTYLFIFITKLKNLSILRTFILICSISFNSVIPLKLILKTLPLNKGSSLFGNGSKLFLVSLLILSLRKALLKTHKYFYSIFRNNNRLDYIYNLYDYTSNIIHYKISIKIKSNIIR
jgi:hypothetical protein